MNGLYQLLKEMGPTKLVAIGLMSVILLGALIMLAIRMTSPVMTPLFGGLSPEDSSQIVGQLQGMGVKYELRNGGSQVMVPSDKVLQLRMSMAKNGLPSSGSVVGYEIFDKSDTLGASSFVNNVNLVRALEGELARTISALNDIESARVHLVLPRRDLFSRQNQKPSASVVLKLRGGSAMDKGEIEAVGHLVATAVPGMDVNNITIVDTQGRPLKLGGEDENDPAVIASNSQQYRASFEQRLKRTIEDIVGRSVGIGKVEAQVSADIDFDRIVTNSEEYDPDGQVARSVQTKEEHEKTNEPGASNVTVANNIPGGQATSTAGGAGSNVDRTDEVTNFEISKTVKNHVKETGTVKRLSIAVLVDGNYTYNQDSGEYEYQPRSEAELKQLTSLVKSAVGFDEKRGDKVDVVNMRFSSDVQGVEKEKPFEWLRRDLSNIIQTVVIGIVVILIILLIVRPMVHRAFEIAKTESNEADLQAVLVGGEPGAAGANLNMELSDADVPEETESIMDIGRFEKKMASSSVGAVNDIIKEHAEETVSVMRQWIEREE